VHDVRAVGHQRVSAAHERLHLAADVDLDRIIVASAVDVPARSAKRTSSACFVEDRPIERCRSVAIRLPDLAVGIPSGVGFVELHVGRNVRR
jgi:hypothetical protein